jgi:putative DNA primase/helicase
MLLDNFVGVLKHFVRKRREGAYPVNVEQQPVLALKSVGFDDFLAIDMPPREMLLHPILPTRSLAMLYAPRGVGKTLLALSIGLAVASGSPLLRWNAPRQRRVLYVDGEMPLVSLQERMRAISSGLGTVIPNDGFRVLAADNTENGLSIGSAEGQRSLDPLLSGVDLVVFDNLSTLCTNGSESASDSWVPMQNWLLKLRRRGIAVLLVHHAGTNGRQRGTSRREDALDTIIALRRPEDYSPEDGARFEVHFEKLRNRIESDGAVPFEANLEAISADEAAGVRWLDCDLRPPVLKQAAQLFKDGLSVREVAGTLRVSKTEAGRLRLRQSLMDCLCPDMATTKSGRMVTIRHRGSPPISFHPSRADGYRCCNPDLRANLSQPPNTPKMGHLDAHRMLPPCH